MLTRLKGVLAPVFETPARGLIRLGLTANAVTLGGLAIALGLCLALAVTGDVLVFVPLIGMAMLLDALDGAVARLSGQVTRTGAYLDALGDRMTDVALCLALAVATGRWLPYALAGAGGLVFSYAKARAEMETRAGNDAWPDLMERTERTLWILGTALVHALFPDWRLAGFDLLDLGLGLVILLIYGSLIQRVRRALRLLGRLDRGTGEPADRPPRA